MSDSRACSNQAKIPGSTLVRQMYLLLLVIIDLIYVLFDYRLGYFFFPNYTKKCRTRVRSQMIFNIVYTLMFSTDLSLEIPAEFQYRKSKLKESQMCQLQGMFVHIILFFVRVSGCLHKSHVCFFIFLFSFCRLFESFCFTRGISRF